MFSTRVTPVALAKHLDDPDWCVVDCRFDILSPEAGPEAYAVNHLPGAVYAHLDTDLSAPVQPGITGRHPLPDPAGLAQKLGAWGIDESVQVVVYDDRSGGIAARLWWILCWLGHEAVAILDGGLKAWTEAGLPTTDEIPSPAERTFTPDLQHHMVAYVEEVQAHYKDPDWLLVDARDSLRYRGIHEPIDPIAGHIPGAVSHPWKENLQEDGTLQEPETLRERFTTLLGDVPIKQAICYCGSGITAAYNVFAMADAGLGIPRLYPGSWSHWITNPKHPVESESEAPGTPPSTAS